MECVRTAALSQRLCDKIDPQSGQQHDPKNTVPFDLNYSMTSQRDPPQKISLTRGSTTNQIVVQYKSAYFVNKNKTVDLF